MLYGSLAKTVYSWSRTLLVLALPWYWTRASVCFGTALATVLIPSDGRAMGHQVLVLSCIPLVYLCCTGAAGAAQAL